MSTIVVGVDGSAGSTKALTFALEEAQRRGANLKVVGAWHIPAIVYEAGWAPAAIDLEDYPKFTQDAVDKALADVGAETSGVEVTTVITKGQAADALCSEARGADLLIVGSRGFGGFRGLLLGSVSAQCSQHTPCPITIIPSRVGLTKPRIPPIRFGGRRPMDGDDGAEAVSAAQLSRLRPKSASPSRPSGGSWLTNTSSATRR